jgi:hypothetical protein
MPKVLSNLLVLIIILSARSASIDSRVACELLKFPQENPHHLRFGLVEQMI